MDKAVPLRLLLAVEVVAAEVGSVTTTATARRVNVEPALTRTTIPSTDAPPFRQEPV